MRTAWPYAKVLRTQLENAAARCAREQREGSITLDQAQAVLEPLRQAIAAARLAEGAAPPASSTEPDLQIVGLPAADPPAPEPAPASLEDAFAMYGGGIYGQ